MAVDIEEIAVLLSRLEVNFSNILSSYFDIFYNNVPQDVTLEYFPKEGGDLQTIQVPNRAKYFLNIKSGDGSPEGHVNGNVGAIYQDLTNGDFYIKYTPMERQDGWKKLATIDNLEGLIVKENGIPEGYNTAPKGTLYIDLTTGSLWIKQTSAGNTGWVEVFRTDLATIRLDNLDEIGEDKLRTSNMYYTGLDQTADILGYKQLEEMYHSQIDTTKFEVNGAPKINDDGSATNFGFNEEEGKENYVFIPNNFFDVGDYPWRFEWAGIMNQQTNSVTYMLGNDSSRQNPNSFLNVYRGASSNNIYFNITTSTGGASGTASNVDLVGGLGNTNNILSGFTNSAYATLADNFTPNSQSWEFNTYITTGTDVTTKQTIVASSNKQYAPFKIEISSGKFVLTVCSSDEEDITSISGSNEISANTGYYVRLAFNGVQYTLSFKQGANDNWTDTAIISSTLVVYSSANPQAVIALGVQCSNATTIYPFLGTIDLKKTEISIGGHISWSGTYRTGTPTQSDVIYLTINSEDNGKKFRAYISYDGLSTNRYTFALKFDGDSDWRIVYTTLSNRTLNRGIENLPFGYRYGLTSVLNLNYIKMYVNEGGGFVPKASFNKTGTATLTNGESIQYVESITGSKIVNAVYRDILVRNYAIDGISEYYVIDEDSREAYLPMGELYGMIFRKPNMSDIPKYTSQLINDSGFITSTLRYCVCQGHYNEEGELDLVRYVESKAGSGPQTVELKYTTSPEEPIQLNFPAATECTVEAISGGAGGKCFDGILIGANSYWYYYSGASGAYYKGTINLTSGSYQIVVGNGGAGGTNTNNSSGGLTKFGLAGGATLLTVNGGNKGSSLANGGSGGSVGERVNFTDIAVRPGRTGASGAGKDAWYSTFGETTIKQTDGYPPSSLANYGKGGKACGPYSGGFSASAMQGTGGYFKLTYQVSGSQGRVGYVNYEVSPTDPLIIIKKDGSKATINGINTDFLNDLTVGHTYNKFVDENGAELLDNTIYTQAPEPTNPQNNDVWIKFGEPLEVYKRVNGEWVDYDKVHIASFRIKTVDDQGTKGAENITCAKFFDNKFQLNASSCPSYVIETEIFEDIIKNEQGEEIDRIYRWYQKYSNGWCAEGGWAPITGGASTNYNVNFFFKYKNNNYFSFVRSAKWTTSSTAATSTANATGYHTKILDSSNLCTGVIVNTNQSSYTDGFTWEVKGQIE